MSGKLILNYNLTVALIVVLILKLWTMVYNLEASILLVILLHLTKD
jgi:hypothetical protein